MTNILMLAFIRLRSSLCQLLLNKSFENHIPFFKNKNIRFPFRLCVWFGEYYKTWFLYSNIYTCCCLTSFRLRVVCVGRWETTRGIEEETIVNLFKYGRPSKHQILFVIVVWNSHLQGLSLNWGQSCTTAAILFKAKCSKSNHQFWGSAKSELVNRS